MENTNTIDKEKLIKAMEVEVYKKFHTFGGEGTIFNETLFSKGFQIAINFIRNYKENGTRTH